MLMQIRTTEEPFFANGFSDRLCYLEVLSSSKYLANISGAFVFGFQRLHRLLHLMKFDARTMLSNCQLRCNPEGQLGLQLYPEKKTTLLCSCAEHFFLIFLNTELVSKNHICVHLCFVYISTNIRFLSNLEYCVFSENVL